MNANENAALLVMDVQSGILNSYKNGSEKLLQTLSAAISTARKQDMQVIYAVLAFRKGYPEINPQNKSFSTIKGSSRNLDLEEARQIPSAIAPNVNDVIVHKKRVSAFTGSDLELVLRSNGIQHLVLTGIATSGVVLSTLREAADKDYKVTVLSDCCADGDEEVHRVLTTKVFPRQAEVMTQQQWMESFSKA